MAAAVDRQEALDRLKELVEGEKGLYVGVPTDERLLGLYLCFADYNVEKAFEKMKLVYSLKAQSSDFYAFRRDPEVHDVILKKGIHMMLKNRDQLGRRIYLIKLGNMVYGEHEPQKLFQVDCLWFNLMMDEEETRQNGLVMVFDMAGMSWKFLRYFTPYIIKPSSNKMENFPLRHIQWHVLNAGRLLNTVIQLVFPFLRQATKEAIYFHKTNESLHAHISPCALPVEYGGELESPQPEVLVKDYLDPRNKRLTELLSYGYVPQGKDK